MVCALVSAATPPLPASQSLREATGRASGYADLAVLPLPVWPKARNRLLERWRSGDAPLPQLGAELPLIAGGHPDEPWARVPAREEGRVPAAQDTRIARPERLALGAAQPYELVSHLALEVVAVAQYLKGVISRELLRGMLAAHRGRALARRPRLSASTWQGTAGPSEVAAVQGLLRLVHAREQLGLAHVDRDAGPGSHKKEHRALGSVPRAVRHLHPRIVARRAVRQLGPDPRRVQRVEVGVAVKPDAEGVGGGGGGGGGKGGSEVEEAEAAQTHQ